MGHSMPSVLRTSVSFRLLSRTSSGLCFSISTRTGCIHVGIGSNRLRTHATIKLKLRQHEFTRLKARQFKHTGTGTAISVLFWLKSHNWSLYWLPLSGMAVQFVPSDPSVCKHKVDTELPWTSTYLCFDFGIFRWLGWVTGGMSLPSQDVGQEP